MAAHFKYNVFSAELFDRNLNVKVCLQHLEGRIQEMYLKCIDSAAAASASFFCDIKASHREVFPLVLLHVPGSSRSYTEKQLHLVAKQLNNNMQTIIPHPLSVIRGDDCEDPCWG